MKYSEIPNKIINNGRKELSANVMAPYTIIQVDNIEIKVINEKPEFQKLEYADNGSAGFDISTINPFVIRPNERKLISTGLKMEIPVGYELQIRPRSGLALKYGITVLNAPGTVDSSYRGEIGIILYNTSGTSFYAETGDRIAQGIFAKYVVGIFKKVENKESLSKTERGEGGFGHTGV